MSCITYQFNLHEYMFIYGIFRMNHTLSLHVHRKLKFKLTQIQMLFSVHDNLAFIKELFIRSRISPVSENMRLIFVCISLFITIKGVEAGLPSFGLSFRAIQCLKLSKLRNDQNPLIRASGLGHQAFLTPYGYFWWPVLFLNLN